METLIRVFSMEDYEQVADLWKASRLEVRPGDDRAAIERKLQRDPELFLVAECGQTVIGSVMGAFDGRRGWIYHLAVHPSYRFQGIGKDLVLEVEQRLKALQCPLVYLMVDPNNEDAIRFYRKMNYQSCEYRLMGKSV
jgi:ribosomal protein S18 acetylase RimI-like enzyme